VQRAAEAVYTQEGQEQIRSLIDYYLQNAKVIRKAFEELGYKCNGGDNSPYIWIKTEKDSWEFFDLLLNKANIICTPGSGFGRCGKGYIRISSFNSQEKVKEAVNRIKTALR